MKNKNKEIKIYDHNDTTDYIDKNIPLKLSDLNITLPKENPTKIISIRIPTKLYNSIKAYSTNIDMPYQAYIKYLLYEGIKKKLKSPGFF
ncbi:MAG: hypothetical protein A2096_17380 [Spirochaetes bacterium GWF1_41_5]|nr:MAG: hypothetical protein A2096_17380 [Spirochaetes bacterium GWF1_41_5]